MNWNEILTQIILSLAGIAISALASFLMYLIKTKVKNEKLANILSDGLKTVSNGVDYVYQIYVENIKDTDLWNEDAMKSANDQAIKYISDHLSQDMKDYFVKTNINMTEWIREQIEITIKNSKANKK